VEIDVAAFFHQRGEGSDALIDELQSQPAGGGAVFEAVRGFAFGRPVEAEDFALGGAAREREKTMSGMGIQGFRVAEVPVGGRAGVSWCRR